METAASDPKKAVKSKTRVIVAGGRDFADYPKLQAVLDEKLAGLDSLEIVSGHAKGADMLGERYAAERGIPCKVFPADWKRYPVRTGFIRNTQMLEYAMQEKPLVIALWDGASHGTKDMIDKARSAGTEYVIIDYSRAADFKEQTESTER